MMLKPFVVLASILLIAVSVGCLEQAHTNAPVDNLGSDDNAEDRCPTKRQPERVCDVYVSAQRDARPRLGQQGNPLVYRQRGQKDDKYYMGVRGVELDHT